MTLTHTTVINNYITNTVLTMIFHENLGQLTAAVTCFL